MTPCGHNFCKACISECLNRKHVCPLCNAPALIQQCHPNLQVDNLLATILKEKEAASRRYFETLFKRSTDGSQNAPVADSVAAPPAAAPAAAGAAAFSPVESLFQKHLRKSLAEFKGLHANMAERRDGAVARAKDACLEKMAKAKVEVERKYGSAVPKSVLETALKPHEEQMEKEVQQIRDAFDRSVAMLLEAFDKQLQQAAPSMATLPVTLTVVVEQSGVQVPQIVVQPTDTIKDVRAAVMQKLEKMSNPVMSQNERCLFFLQRAYDVGSAASKKELLTEVTPLGTLKIEPGSVIVWSGDVKLKSDQPAMCFTLTYKKDQKETIDYFSCRNCGINWICPACVKSCHAGHDVTGYLKNHVPNWACCYCSKKNLCKIDKKK